MLPTQTKAIKIIYRNHRGLIGLRSIIPIHIVHKRTEFHPEPQWLIHCWDQDKKAYRDYALSDFLGFLGGPVLTFDMVGAMAVQGMELAKLFWYALGLLTTVPPYFSQEPEAVFNGLVEDLPGVFAESRNQGLGERNK